jgi:hypothetical protein
MVLPFSEEGANKTADVTLEMDLEGHQYLHLVLPADKINFLNGGDSILNATSFRGEDTESFDYEQLMVEVGCKVFEVNRVAYKPSHAVDFPLDIQA